MEYIAGTRGESEEARNEEERDTPRGECPDPIPRRSGVSLARAAAKGVEGLDSGARDSDRLPFYSVPFRFLRNCVTFDSRRNR
jgi:hypothetical protein